MVWVLESDQSEQGLINRSPRLCQIQRHKPHHVLLELKRLVERVADGRIEEDSVSMRKRIPSRSALLGQPPDSLQNSDDGAAYRGSE